jgi:hypothetical protein
MPTIANAPTLIPAPPPPPRPPGLFDVALGPMQFPNDAGVMGGGIIYVPDTCEDDVFLYAMNCPSVSGSKTFSAIEPAVSGSPFGVYTSYTCGSIGFTFAEVEQRVRLRMQLREQRAVERRVWQGVPAGGTGGIPGHFQSAATLTAAGCITEALFSLEQALADNGVVGGMIHARPGMGAILAQQHLIERTQRGQVFTMNGTPVVLGHGYNGTGPAGQATTATTEYMYASGRVLIWGSDTWVPPVGETMDRALNQIYTVAERIFVTIVECGSWAVQVTHDCTTD